MRGVPSQEEASLVSSIVFYMRRKWLWSSILVIIVLLLVAIALSGMMTLPEALRAVFGATAILFVPGFIWSFALWSAGRLDVAERFAFSVSLSLAITPLSIFLAAVIGVKVTGMTVVLVTVVVSLAGFATALYRRRDVLESSNY